MRSKIPENAGTYGAADEFVRAGLRSSDSMFVPGRSIWSLVNLDELHRRFVEEPDLSKATFLQKLERQLADAPDDVVLLAAEVLYTHLVVARISGATKRELIQAVLGWMDQSVPMPESLSEALDHGLANPGTAFNTLRYFQIGYLIDVARHWKNLGEDRREQALADPWAFKGVLMAVEPKGGSYAQREALLHLVHADTFEPILSRDIKKRIIGAFYGPDESPEDPDRALLELRGRLESEFGSDFHWYLPGIEERWRPVAERTTWVFQANPSRYDLLAAARRGFDDNWAMNQHRDKIVEGDQIYFYESGARAGIYVVGRALSGAHEEEVTDDFGRFKVDVEYEHLIDPPLLRSELMEDPILGQSIVFQGQQGTNFIVPDAHASRLAELIEDRRRPLEPPVSDEWHLAPGDEIRRVELHARYGGSGQTGISPSSRTPNVLLFTDLGQGSQHGYIYDGWEDDSQAVFLYTGEGQQGDQKLVSGNKAIAQHAEDGRRLRLFDGARRTVRYVGEFAVDSEQPIEPRQAPATGGGPSRQVLVFRLRPVGATAPVSTHPPHKPQTVTRSMDWLVAQTLWSEPDLLQLINALEGPSPQIVLAGPPGTGKTWVARHLAEYLTQGEPGATRLVQFHPSYTYEQFLEGLRPVVEQGAVQFKRVDGVVLDIVRHMDPSKDRRILLIDEMNRANLPKVLGELMYLFEYRDEPISLQYSPQFQLPKGLLFIGTMNTADRSIRSIDVALRRRFDVFECPPDPDVLARYYDSRENDVEGLVEGFVALNEALTKQLDRHHTIGHTFFMSDPMTVTRLAQVWERKIAPLIDEYFFDQPDLAAEFSASVFWPVVKP